MYSLKVEGNFSSAHNLRGYKGKCEELHGHNWRVQITAKSAKLDKSGLMVDFRFLKEKLNDCLEKLDHKYLNKIKYFSGAGKNPTSENIAEYIYNELKGKIPQISSVTVWENPTCSATYEK